MTDIKKTCQNCGKEAYDVDQNFCGRCGQKFANLTGDCPVCLEESNDMDVLSCGHKFCKAHCFHRCLSKCPICRKIPKNVVTIVQQEPIADYNNNNNTTMSSLRFKCKSCNYFQFKQGVANTNSFHTNCLGCKKQLSLNNITIFQ